MSGSGRGSLGSSATPNNEAKRALLHQDLRSNRPTCSQVHCCQGVGWTETPNEADSGCTGRGGTLLLAGGAGADGAGKRGAPPLILVSHGQWLELQMAQREQVGHRESMIDWDKVDEVTFALMHLTTFEDHGAIRSWKGHDWDVLNRLFERGWISDPVSKAKSVVLSDEDRKRSEELFLKHLGRAV